MDRGYNPKQFIANVAGRGKADGQVERIYASEFEVDMPRGGSGKCWRSFI